jgi:hypothetical protein
LRKRFEQKNELDESESSYLMKDSSTFEYTNDSSNESYFDIDFDDSIDSDNDNTLSKILLKFKIIKKFRQEFFKLFKEKQKNFDQTLFNFRYLLTLDFEKVYIVEDLENERILNRVLRLLYLTKFEKQQIHIRISSHINYNKFSLFIINAIKVKQNIKKNQINESLILMNIAQL